MSGSISNFGLAPIKEEGTTHISNIDGDNIFLPFPKKGWRHAVYIGNKRYSRSEYAKLVIKNQRWFDE